MKLKGSSLIFSFVVLSFLLVSALSVAVVSVTSRRSSLATKNSNVAFQVADSAAEVMLAKIYKDTGTILTPAGLASSLGTSCLNAQIGPNSIGAGTYKATLYTKEGVAIACDDTTWRDVISKVKFQGIYQSTTRAIEVAITPPCNPVTDAGGNKYNTILIGTQCWMAQNLNVGTTMILGSASPSDNGIIEKWCYNDVPANCTSDGGLYSWNEMMGYSTSPGAQGICPTGWHVPTHDEYTTLERAVCTSSTCVTDFPIDNTTIGQGGTNEGSKLSLYTSGGNNSSEFGAILAGYRNTVGSFYSRSSATYLWSSTPSGGDAWIRILGSGFTTVYRNTYAKAYGFSVRCLKD